MGARTAVAGLGYGAIELITVGGSKRDDTIKTTVG
jgi:hypothetical protein